MPNQRERIAPTGSAVAVFVLGDPIRQRADNGEGPPLETDQGFLVGPHERPAVNEPQGETHAVGIVTTPVGCQTVLGVEPRSIRGQVVELATAWPDGAPLRAELVATPDPEAALDHLARRLTDLVAARPPSPAWARSLDRCEAAVALLAADPVRPIAEIAAEVGVSHGHLDDEFTRIVGLSPRVLARIHRLRTLLTGIDADLDVDWVERAHQLGWFDQAHLIRDFRRHVGVTPTQYVLAQRAAYTSVQGEDAAGFAPEPPLPSDPATR